MAINWISGTAILGTTTTDVSIGTSVSTNNCTALGTNQSVRNVFIRVVNGATPPTVRPPISIQVSNDNTNFATIHSRSGSSSANGVVEFVYSTEHWQHMRIVIDNSGGTNPVSARIIEGRKDITPGT